MIINGAMKIDQRNNGSSINLGNGKFYSVDRFFWIENSSETPTGQQVTDAPVGFTHSNKITNTSTTTTPTYTQLNHPIEGNNVSKLYFGNSSAKSVTLSFYVKSSLTGQFSAALRNGGDNRSNVSTYTINSANTWERKNITFAGDTSGTWATNNTIGLNVIFRLDDSSGTSTLNQWTASGSAFASGGVRFMGNASATWQITGIQLEEGSQMTDFEHRSFGEELLLCKRYYTQIEGGSDAFTFPGKGQGSTTVDGIFPLAVPLRASPTMNSINSRFFTDSGFSSTGATPTANQFIANNDVLAINIGGYSGGASFTNNEVGVWGVQAGTLTINAEL